MKITTEQILTAPFGFGLDTASPAQRVAARLIDGLPLGNLRRRAHAAEIVGGKDALKAALKAGKPNVVVYLRKSIIGFKELEKEVRRRTSFEQDVRYLGGWAADYSERIARLTRPLASRRAVAETLRTRLVELHALLLRRHREKTARARDVLVGDDVHQLAGIEIVDAEKHHEKILRDMLANFRRAFDEHPPIDGGRAETLKRMASKASKAADAAQAWIRSTKPFLTLRNLNLALVALRKDGASVEHRAGGWHVNYFGAGGGAVLEDFSDAD